MTFVEFVTREKEKTDQALREFFLEQRGIASEIDPELVNLTDECERLFLSGGKRARPLLVRLAYGLAGGKNISGIMRVSLFVELIHWFLLVHDDVVDRDLKRYGRDTLEVVYSKLFQKKFGRKNSHYGRSIAVISGDLLQVMAHDALYSSDFSAEVVAKVESQMTLTIKQAIAGWHIHQTQNNQSIRLVSEKRYLDGMKLVSASYSFEAPLLIGLMLAEQNSEMKETLKEFAHHCGIAFQIRDDILGVFGDYKMTGKPVGNDIREGKKTLLVLKAYELADRKGKAFLENKLGSNLTSSDLVDVQDLIKEVGSLEYSEKLALESSNKAKSVIVNLEANKRAVVERLVQLADFVSTRES